MYKGKCLNNQMGGSQLCTNKLMWYGGLDLHHLANRIDKRPLHAFPSVGATISAMMVHRWPPYLHSMKHNQSD